MRKTAEATARFTAREIMRAENPRRLKGIRIKKDKNLDKTRKEETNNTQKATKPFGLSEQAF